MPCWWGTTRQGAGQGQRHTSRTHLRQARARWTEGRRRDRTLRPTGALRRRATVRGQGPRHSEAMTDQAASCSRSRPRTRRVRCPWRNRRRQRQADPWAAVHQALRQVGGPQGRRRVHLHPGATLHAGTKSRRWDNHASGSVRVGGTTDGGRRDGGTAGKPGGTRRTHTSCLEHGRPHSTRQKLMRPRTCSISGAPRAVPGTGSGLHALRLGCP
jgi:hypothetical protein